MFLYSANDVTSKFYYTSVILFYLNGFITLLRRGLCDNMFYLLNKIRHTLWVCVILITGKVKLVLPFEKKVCLSQIIINIEHIYLRTIKREKQVHDMLIDIY
jgi:hypothetical protein